MVGWLIGVLALAVAGLELWIWRRAHIYKDTNRPRLGSGQLAQDAAERHMALSPEEEGS
jgi:hypothetical protein